jgi:hypothetical protein
MMNFTKGTERFIAISPMIYSDCAAVILCHVMIKVNREKITVSVGSCLKKQPLTNRSAAVLYAIK